MGFSVLKLDPNTGVYNRKHKRIYFELYAPKAKQVLLIGDFNFWDEDGIPLKKNKKGTWRVGVSLFSGRYEYKFKVDEDWWTDPKNPSTKKNIFGTINSVKKVTV